MRCFRGITTTRHLCFSDGDNVEASFTKSGSINELRAPARLLSDALVHFHGSHEEVCLSASSTHVTLSNVPDDSVDIAKTTRTNLSLSVDEFESVRLKGSTELTFCLKETKGMLLFAESSNYPVSIHFDSPGRPIVFSLQDSVLEADFVLATQSEVANSQPHEQRSPSSRCQEDVDGFDDMDSFMLAMDTTHMEEGGDGGDDGATTTSMEEPGRKKLRALLFEAPSQQQPVAQEVLAEDSEPE
ncbi:cell cycle checkpoint control protein RAD9A isoform X2 [Lampetra fluviatilis]